MAVGVLYSSFHPSITSGVTLDKVPNLCKPVCSSVNGDSACLYPHRFALRIT